MSLQPVILSGGSGTRLWPLSRESYPKQFLPLTGERTMLQETVHRVDGLDGGRAPIELQDPIVVCNDAHRFLVAEQFRVLNRHTAAIVLEPVGRNTAPALTLAALTANAGGADPVLLAMPADHTIGNESAFREAVKDGYLLAQRGAVITFGIVPTKPETGYGYIRQGPPVGCDPCTGPAFQLQAFVEKPDLDTAQSYLESGEFLWNSGIFMMKSSRWLELIGRFHTDIAEAASKALKLGTREDAFVHLDGAAFEACPSDSIDYAVMEHISGEDQSDEALVLPLDVGWSDVGAWSALWEVRNQDEAGNVCEGDTFVHDAHNNLLLAHDRMVAAVGVNDLVVVSTKDAVLVATKERAQDVKAITQRLKLEERKEHRHHREVHRPWGAFESIDDGAAYQVKRLTVKPGERLSLQMHHHRAEHWIVVSGTARVTNEDRVFLLTENESTYIPKGAKHRLENPGKIPLEIIEVQSGSYLEEDDIVRFDDIYNRTADETN